MSTTPIQIWIRTDVRETTLSIPGPMMMVKVPGTRILGLAFDQPQLYGIRIITCDREFRLEEVPDPSVLTRVESILIFDGFLVSPGFLHPGWSFVPSYLMGNVLVESGNTYIYPALCPPPLPPPPLPGPPPGPFAGPSGAIGPPPPPGRVLGFGTKV